MTLTEFAKLVRDYLDAQKAARKNAALAPERDRLENAIKNELMYILEPQLFAHFPEETEA